MFFSPIVKLTTTGLSFSLCDDHLLAILPAIRWEYRSLACSRNFPRKTAEN
jgi:hypothetical protein